MRKFWTIKNSEAGTAHLNREGRVVDFRVGVVYLSDEQHVSAIPKDGVSEKASFPIKGKELISTEEVDDYYIRKFRVEYLVGGLVGVLLVEEKEETPERLERRKRDREVVEDAQRRENSICRGWVLERLENPLEGLNGRVIGRCKRFDGRREAACAVVECWLKQHPLEGFPRFRGLYFLSDMAGEREEVGGVIRILRPGADVILEAVISASDRK